MGNQLIFMKPEKGFGAVIW